MSSFEISLIVGAIVVAIVSIRNPRGVAWIAAITADLMASTAYWKAGLPYGEVITGLCDASICLGINFIGRYEWELWLWRLYQGSVLVSLVYLFFHVFAIPTISQDVYSSLLEAINWVAFISIGGSSVSQAHRMIWLRWLNDRAFRPWRRFRGSYFTLYGEAGTIKTRSTEGGSLNGSRDHR